MQSRTEEILQSIIDGSPTPELQPPQSRVEVQLMEISDLIAEISEKAGKLPIHICGSDEYNPITGEPIIQNPQEDIFYLVPSGEAPNLYNEWVWHNQAWEQFGSASVEIEVDDHIDENSENPVQNNVIKIALDGKVDAVSGKGLSTNDYTTAEKDKLGVIDRIVLVQSGTPDESANKLWMPSSESEFVDVPTVDEVEAGLSGKLDADQGVGNAGKTLIVGNDGNVSLGANLNTKVDAVSGKGLSTNDYTTAEKAKLADIDNIVVISDTEPSEDSNKLWIPDDEADVAQVPSWTEFTTGLAEKLDISQGVANAGKAMVVGVNGNIAPGGEIAMQCNIKYSSQNGLQYWDGDSWETVPVIPDASGQSF